MIASRYTDSPGRAPARTSLARRAKSAPRGLAALIAGGLLAALVPWIGATGPAAAAPSEVTAASNVEHVDPLIGTTGANSTEYGGMIPSTAPPFAMTRWSPMTRTNYVSRLPYHHNDTKITGFIGTHQPAIWMGDSGYVVGMPGIGAVKTAEADRGLPFTHADETAAPDKYTVNMTPAPGQTLKAELTGTSRVGHLRLTYPQGAATNFVMQATRSGITGNVHIDPAKKEITGYNPDRQDSKLGPSKAPGFKGYFVARFDTAFDSYGTAKGATQFDGEADRTDQDLAGYVRFPAGSETVNVRIATSFISVDQARANLDAEVPDGQSFDATAAKTRAAWADKLDRVDISGATPDERTTFYTSMYHALQYPSEMSEQGRYYSAYDDKVHDGVSYTGYSLWDTFRAQNAFLTLFAPERIDDMVTSMLQDYKQSGWLPMWKNFAETNIMVGTNADSIIAEAIAKGFDRFDLDLAYEAVRKNAMTPPDKDTELWWGDRQQGTPAEARAGLTTYKQNGWVAADRTAEAGSRTLDYAYEDWAVAQVAKAAGNTDDATFFLDRSKNYKNLYNPTTGFMQARNFDGSWNNGGWTEGDKWVYTNDVMHDVLGLIALKGGDAKFTEWLDSYFDGGHNNQTNEPSHHSPYLYNYAGRPWKTQELVRQIADENYHAAPDGLSGNDDCGQMSAWYLFSAMGFYPVNPASGEYAVGSPMFDKVTLRLPGTKKPLVIKSKGAELKPYVKGLSLNGKRITKPFLSHSDLTGGGNLKFTMDAAPQSWGASTTPPPAKPVNLAAHKPITMINGTPATAWGKPAENAVDGNLATMAQATTSDPWSLKVDLGASTTVRRMEVNPDWENYPTSYDLKVSQDGTNWTTVAGEADSGGTTDCAAHGVQKCGQPHSYTFPKVKARYALLSVNSWVSAKTGTPANGYGWGLKEFGVFATS
ncbi:GH92 family glycosyl hydrolase [Streptomyces sp. NBC_01591]|uniref:GH92 family glycosyl hydrolase n=1 Tax=Streptomyces sp. NBC_01591 TaxID=2975888 RepID=UPI002DD9876E|nr:GH92 family glycosyl hydrolase [Streptomyces sp. NBC_01591]WSD72429.1 GH92 family glycosyl hydrolase [Streptomyces sp. NBC_01591]